MLSLVNTTLLTGSTVYRHFICLGARLYSHDACHSHVVGITKYNFCCVLQIYFKAMNSQGDSKHAELFVCQVLTLTTQMAALAWLICYCPAWKKRLHGRQQTTCPSDDVSAARRTDSASRAPYHPTPSNQTSKQCCYGVC